MDTFGLWGLGLSLDIQGQEVATGGWEGSFSPGDREAAWLRALRLQMECRAIRRGQVTATHTPGLLGCLEEPGAEKCLRQASVAEWKGRVG